MNMTMQSDIRIQGDRIMVFWLDMEELQTSSTVMQARPDHA